MATVSEAVDVALLKFPGHDPNSVQVGDWHVFFGVEGVAGSRHKGKLVFIVPDGSGGFVPVTIPLVCSDLGLATEDCLCNHRKPNTTEQRQAAFDTALVNWVAARRTDIEGWVHIFIVQEERGLVCSARVQGWRIDSGTPPNALLKKAEVLVFYDDENTLQFNWVSGGPS